MQVPKFSIKDFLTIPVLIVGGLGAISTIMQWGGHSIVSQDEIHSQALAKADSVNAEILRTLQRIEQELKSDDVLREAQIRGECLENDLETVARQGLLNACQDRNLLIGRTITPAVSAAAAEARVPPDAP